MNIVDFLFETGALQVCDEDRPFWYTSGKLGPYYINTHYLYGSPGEATDLLAFVDSFENPRELPKALHEKIMQQVSDNYIYKKVINLLLDAVKDMDFDFISGGERRDFFFSIPLAALLKIPHLSIMKDMTLVYSENDFTVNSLKGGFSVDGKKALHIADLVTAASSYLRAWIPAIRQAGAVLNETVAIVDRDQGGGAALAEAGVKLKSLTLIGPRIFSQALDQDLINKAQLELIASFTEDPDTFMLKFFKKNPDFLNKEIESGGRNKERALLCMEKGFHLDPFQKNGRKL